MDVLPQLRRPVPLFTCILSLCAGAASAVSAATYLPIYGSPISASGGSSFTAEVQVPTNLHRFVNDAGVAVGLVGRVNSAGFSADLRAVRWMSQGAGFELKPLSTDNRGVANVQVYAINNNGVSVGEADLYDSAGNALGTRAVRWDAAGNVTELGHLGADSDGYAKAQAIAVNAGGTAAGMAYKQDQLDNYLGYFAVRWDASSTTAIELGTLGSDLRGMQYALATDINNSGVTIGHSRKFDPAGNSLGTRAVRWNPSQTVPIELEVLSTNQNGGTSTHPNAINSAGVAVGYAAKFTPNGTYLGRRAVRWNPSGEVTELDSLLTDANGYTHVEAVDVNDTGVTLGFGNQYRSNGAAVPGPHVMRWSGNGTEVDELGGGPFTWPRDINNHGMAVGTLNNRAVLWPFRSTTSLDLNTLIPPTSGWLLYEALSISDTGWITGWGAYLNRPRLFLMRVPLAGMPEPSTATLLMMAVLSANGCRRRSMSGQ